MSNFLKNSLLLVVSMVISLIVGEFAVRIYFRDITSTADNRSYFAGRWKANNVKLNSFGFREREFEPQKAPGTYRIAFIGDSYAFGQGVPEANRMSNLLEQSLVIQGRRVEVLNFGNPGNNTADEVAVLQKMLPIVKPDFVLLQWYVNDVEAKQPASAAAGPSASPSSLNQFRMMMRSTLATYFLAGEVWHRILDQFGGSRTQEIVRLASDPSSPDVQQMKGSLQAFFKAAREAGAGVGVVLVPELIPLEGKPYPLIFLHQRVTSACDEAQVPCVDLLPTFEPYMADSARYRGLWVNRFDPHMGIEANQLAGKRLLEFFGPILTANASTGPQ